MELKIMMKGKAGKARAKAKKPQVPAGIIPPTDEQMDRFQLVDVLDKQPNGRSMVISKTFRRVPMIDTLHGQGVLSDAEHKALRHYRHHADAADRSPTRDSLANAACPVRGSVTAGPSWKLLHAQRVRDDCERAAGSLVDILRAVVVDDMSLSQWAIHVAGGLDTRRVKGGRVQSSVEPRKAALDIARLEIKMAAGRVQGELDA